MQKSKIKLVTGVPCRFTLENDKPREMSSKFTDGVEYMYSVVHQGEQSILFLPVDGMLAIKRVGAQEGDEVELTKATAQDRSIVYQCRRFSDAHLAMPAPPPAPRPAPETQGVRMLAPRSQVVPSPIYAPAAQTQAAPAPVQTDGANTALAKRCFRAAIDVLVDARAYGQQHQVELTFNEEDVRALGITFLIGEQKAGR